MYLLCLFSVSFFGHYEMNKQRLSRHHRYWEQQLLYKVIIWNPLEFIWNADGSNLPATQSFSFCNLFKWLSQFSSVRYGRTRSSRADLTIASCSIIGARGYPTQITFFMLCSIGVSSWLNNELCSVSTGNHPLDGRTKFFLYMYMYIYIYSVCISVHISLYICLSLSLSALSLYIYTYI